MKRHSFSSVSSAACISVHTLPSKSILSLINKFNSHRILFVLFSHHFVNGFQRFQPFVVQFLLGKISSLIRRDYAPFSTRVGVCVLKRRRRKYLMTFQNLLSKFLEMERYQPQTEGPTHSAERNPEQKI
jgi:hypothetical protein